MKVLLTGQVGLDKARYLGSAQRIAKEQRWKLTYRSVGRRMRKDYPRPITDATILNLPRDILDLLARGAWYKILSEVGTDSRESEEAFVVNAHAVFRWRHGLVPALNLALLRRFQPDIVAVLVDDVLQVKQGLRERQTDIFELWELFAWREEEIWFSKSIADSLSGPSKKVRFVIVPKAQGPSLLVQVLFEPAKPKAYTSFPITGVTAEEQKSIDQFKARIAKEFIAFDPYGIKDRELTLLHNTIKGEIREEVEDRLDALVKSLKDRVRSDRPRWLPYVDDLSTTTITKLQFDETEILGRELVSALGIIDSQIISRDYLLIDQADVVIMYIAMDKSGRPQVSAGCQSEMLYAFNSGKKVCVVFPGEEEKLSPWITQHSQVFASVDEASEYLM